MEVGTKTATGDDDGVGTNAHPPAHKVGQVLVALLIYHGHKLQTAQCSRAKRRKREHVMLYDRSGDALQSEGVDSSPPPPPPPPKKNVLFPNLLVAEEVGPWKRRCLCHIQHATKCLATATRVRAQQRSKHRACPSTRQTKINSKRTGYIRQHTTQTQHHTNTHTHTSSSSLASAVDENNSPHESFHGLQPAPSSQR